MKRVLCCLAVVLLHLSLGAVQRETMDEYGYLDFGVSRYLFAPSAITFLSAVRLDMNYGIKDVLYNSYQIDAELSSLCNPELRLIFRNDEEIIDRFELSNRFKIFRFMHIVSGYTWWNYSEYSVDENNFYLYTDMRVDIFKYVRCLFITGGALKLIDLDTTDPGTVYTRDYVAQIIFLWKLSFNFFVSPYYHMGIELSDMYDNDPFSFGYFQISLLSTFTSSKRYAVTLDGGVGFAGSGSLAGFPNKIWIALGGKYVQPFTH